ncbi:hypothetical protein M8818_006176 [Zalaria obscura]|uniref:Uncharacterized protein n=1 Tax=Zalaria obscura TaxID=2024903 RepID=A0ACC3S852_9PEZI
MSQSRGNQSGQPLIYKLIIIWPEAYRVMIPYAAQGAISDTMSDMYAKPPNPASYSTLMSVTGYTLALLYCLDKSYGAGSK